MKILYYKKVVILTLILFIPLMLIVGVFLPYEKNIQGIDDGANYSLRGFPFALVKSGSSHGSLSNKQEKQRCVQGGGEYRSGYEERTPELNEGGLDVSLFDPGYLCVYKNVFSWTAFLGNLIVWLVVSFVLATAVVRIRNKRSGL